MAILWLETIDWQTNGIGRAFIGSNVTSFRRGGAAQPGGGCGLLPAPANASLFPARPTITNHPISTSNKEGLNDCWHDGEPGGGRQARDPQIIRNMFTYDGT